MLSAAPPPGSVLFTVSDDAHHRAETIAAVKKVLGPNAVDVTQERTSLRQGTNELHKTHVSQETPSWLSGDLAAAWKSATENCSAQLANVDQVGVMVLADKCTQQRADFVWSRFLKETKPSEVVHVYVEREKDPKRPAKVEVHRYEPTATSETMVTSFVPAGSTTGLENAVTAARKGAGNKQARDPNPPEPEKPQSGSTAFGSSAKTDFDAVPIPAECKGKVASSLKVTPNDALAETVTARYEKSASSAKDKGPAITCALASSRSDQDFMGMKTTVVDVKLTCGEWQSNSSSSVDAIQGDKLLDKTSKQLISGIINAQCGIKKRF